MSMQHHQNYIHPYAMPPTVRNVYNIRPWDNADYMKKKVDLYMLFMHVGNNLNTDVL